MVSAAAATTAASHLIFSSSQSISRFAPFQTCSLRHGGRRRHAAAAGGSGGGVRCMAVAEGTEAKSKSGYKIETLTNWLLKQEQVGAIDAELTIVLSSISMACKQIASLVQRASISNLTGVQGAVNVQGEDQKKLDVVSNEVSIARIYFFSTIGTGSCGPKDFIFALALMIYGIGFRLVL